MPLQIFVINGCVLCKPLPHEWTVYVVVVDPSLVAGVVGWINIDAFDAVGVARQQRFEGVQVVAVDDEVVVFIGRVAGAGFVGFEWAVGDGEVVGIDVLFSFEFECGYRESLQNCENAVIIVSGSGSY